jgi:branched-chain amino acid transport system ATP-binding protein
VNTLRVKKLSAGYDKKTVLRRVSFSVRQGEIVGIVGENGAGKSTLLRVIMGIVRPTGGRILFESKEITFQDTVEKVRKGISFVCQGGRVFGELSVLENLHMGGYLISRKKELTSQIDVMLEIFPDLKNLAERKAAELSGGEKQQLALARALMIQPRLLLMDEPSLGLSPERVENVFEAIRLFNQKSGATIVIVEQKIPELKQITSRILTLSSGKIVFSGPPSDSQPKVEIE